MFNFKIPPVAVIASLSAFCAPTAHAQWAVIDVGAIAQLVQQYETLQQQLVTAQNHLMQARQEFQSITGTRGMQNLLAGTNRNYLPSDWTSFEVAVQNSGSALGMDVSSAMAADAVLTPVQLAALSPSAQQQIVAWRRSASSQQAVAREALSNSSGRFASIQKLIDAIPTAADQKAVLDLQARIGAEQAMLQNERTKLQVLYQSMQADQQADAQRVRELIIAGHGQFDTRFQPTP